MTALAALWSGSDLVAAVSLAVLAALLGLPRADRVTAMYLRKRREIALIFAIAGLHRLTAWTGAPAVALIFHLAFHVASAVVACLSASAAVVHVLGGRRHGA